MSRVRLAVALGSMLVVGCGYDAPTAPTVVPPPVVLPPPPPLPPSAPTPIAISLTVSHKHRGETSYLSAGPLLVAIAEPATYTWTFGDGQRAETRESRVEHVYEARGFFSPAVSVVDALGRSASDSITIEVTDGTSSSSPSPPSPAACPSLTIVAPSTPLPASMVGFIYNQTFTVSGGTAPYYFDVIAGTVPPGTAMKGPTLYGVLTAAGSSAFTVRALDSNSCTGVLATSVYIAPIPVASCPTISLTPTTLAGGTVGVAYSQALTASGGTAPYTFTVSAGSLPAGILLSSTGLSGTPTSSGTFAVTLRAVDASNCAGTVATSIVVAPAPPTMAATMTCTAAAAGAASACNVSVTYGGTALPSANVTNVVWDFGDGSTSTTVAPLVSHTYTLPGSYTVFATVTATTSDGPKTATVTRGVANDKSPGDYQTRRGIVTEMGPGRAEYGVQFDDGQHPSTGHLMSWWLDPI